MNFRVKKIVNKIGTSINLNNQILKTPANNVLLIPHKKPVIIADRIIHELQNKQLPIMTSLACKSIDQLPKHRELASSGLLKYLDTDSMLVFNPESDCSGKVRKAQLQMFPPIISKAEKIWKVRLNTLDTERKLFGNYQTLETRERVKGWINSLDNWEYTSLEMATTVSKSLIIGMLSVTHQSSLLDLQTLSLLEINHQIKEWGSADNLAEIEDLILKLESAYLLNN